MTVRDKKGLRLFEFDFNDLAWGGTHVAEVVSDFGVHETKIAGGYAVGGGLAVGGRHGQVDFGDRDDYVWPSVCVHRRGNARSENPVVDAGAGIFGRDG